MKTIKYRVVATKQESLIPENVHAYLGKHPDTTGEIDPARRAFEPIIG